MRQILARGEGRVFLGFCHSCPILEIVVFMHTVKRKTGNRPQTSGGSLFTIPNLLTLLRLALLPVLFLLLEGAGTDSSDLGPKATSGQVAACLVLFLGFTDFLDGFLARKWGQESAFGALVDPIADKFVLLVGIVELLVLGRVPGWLVILLFGRELAVTGLRAISASEGVVIAADKLGKLKLCLQLAGMACLMWQTPLFGIPMEPVGLWTLYAALILSLWGGARYFFDYAQTAMR